MFKFKKALLLVAFLTMSLILGIMFSGCVKPGSKITLRCAFWGDTSEIEIIKKSVENFKKANPGIDVKLERLPAGDAYTEKIVTQIAGGNSVDVMFVNAEQFYIYAKKGILLPLNDFVSRDNMPVNKFYPKIIEKFTVDKNLYVLPRDIAPVCVVFYNKEIFNANGLKYPGEDWNWDNMRSLAAKMTKKNSDGSTTFGFADEWGIWEPFVLSNGGRLVDDLKKPSKCLLDSPEALAAFGYRQDLMYKYKVMPSPSQLSAMGGVGAADLFVNGKAAMFLSGIWKTPYFRQTVKFDWDAQVFPEGPAGGRGWLVSGGGYSILKSTKHPEEAWKLLTFLAGEEGQKALAMTGLAQPAIKAIAESGAFLDGKPPLSKKFLLDSVNYGCFAPDTDKWQESLNSYIFPALDKIWANEKKPYQVMPDAVKKVNKLINEAEK
ncbi:MAG: sugar ABC transporter substrate-binding protein [Candidatus Goldiibacteriota bacterium]|jgi:multiple sugar transport system substrate-binding protein